MSDDLLDLPEGWEWTITSEVCSSVRDGTHDSPKYVEQGIPLITSKNLRNGQIDFLTAKFISIEDHKLISVRSGVESGDILFAMIGTIGNPVVVIKTQEFSIKNVALFKKNESLINSFFLKYWLSSYYFYKILEQKDLIKGTTQKFLPLATLRTLPTPLPPLNEQKRIVAKIEELNDRSQTAQKALETIPQLCDRFRQSVLAAAFRGDLTADWREKNPDVEPASVLLEKLNKRSPQFEEDLSEYDLSDIPDSWLWVNVESIGDVKGGKRLPKGESLVDENTGYPYIKAGNLKNGTVILSEIQFIPKHIQTLIKNYTVVSGDVYITIVGACIGDAGIIPTELDGANLTENAAKICNLFGVNNEYLALWLRSSLCQEIIKSKILSAAQGKLAITRIKTLPIPLPPIHEQIAIINILQDLINFPARVTKYQMDIKSKLEKLNQSILSKAFRGELVPQDPDDEPASVLLERIRAEREKLNNSKPKSKPTTKRKTKTPKEQATIPGLE